MKQNKASANGYTLYSDRLFSLNLVHQYVCISSFSLIISLRKENLNRALFLSLYLLSSTTTQSLGSCKEFFSVLLCAMSIILFLAWHRRNHQHKRNSSASPRENSANKGDEQGVYLIHHEQFLKLTPKF